MQTVEKLTYNGLSSSLSNVHFVKFVIHFYIETLYKNISSTTIVIMSILLKSLPQEEYIDRKSLIR